MTAFNILDLLFMPKVPALLARLHVAVLCEKQTDEPDEQFRERIVIQPPTDEAIVGGTIVVEFKTRFHVALHNFSAIRFNDSGRHIVRVERSPLAREEWAVVKERSLIAELAPHPLMPGHAPAAAAPK